MEDVDAEKKIIRCDFRKKNLFSCILEDLHGEDFKKVVHEKFRKVQEAYDQIKKERGIK